MIPRPASPTAPRFYVSEFRGFDFDPALMPHRPSGREGLPLVVQVHDRVYCHRTIASFEAKRARKWKFGTLTRGEREEWARRQARRLAYRLNAKHERGLT